MAKSSGNGLVVVSVLAAVLFAGSILGVSALASVKLPGGNPSGSGGGYAIAISTSGIVVERLSECELGQEGDRSKGPAGSQEALESSLEDAAQMAFQGLMGKTVTLASLEESVAYLQRLQRRAPRNLKVNMILLQLLDMKTEMLGSVENGDKASPILEAAKIARLMYEHEDLPERVRFRFASYVFEEAAVYAARADAPRCLASLEQAASMGFSDIEEADERAEFARLREDPEFLAAVARLSKQVAIQLRAEFETALQRFESFPFQFDLIGPDGEPVSLADFKGRVVVLDFMGSWCRPCVAELPVLASIQVGNPIDQVKVLCMAYERSGNRDEKVKRIERLLAEQGAELDFLLIDGEFTKRIPNFEAYPTKLLIDPQGRSRLMLIGPQSARRLQVAIDLLLGE